jgi:PKD repeat protein
MKKICCLVILRLFFLPGIVAQTNVTIYAFNKINSTGYVEPDNSNHSGNMQDIIRYQNYGYMTFDLGTIPATAIITAATLNFYVNGAVTTVVVAYLGKLTRIPVVTSDAPVRYAEVSGGEVLCDNVPWDGVIGEKACSFNAAGISAIQSRIGSLISFGLYPSQETNNGYYSIIGYTGGTGASGHAPYLSLTYTTGSAKKPATAFYADDTSPYVNNAVQFFDNSGNYPTSWLWDFGDGSTSTAKNPVHVYDSIATYTVTLKAGNSSGDSTLMKTNYMQVTEAPMAPMADFKADTTYVETGYSIQFSDSSKNAVTAWAWDFGDLTGATEQNPSYTYPAEGVYTVRLVVTGPGGIDTIEKENYITVVDMLTAPLADFSYTADGLTVSFTDLSFNYPNSWSWDFDADNNPGAFVSSEQNPVFTYSSPGTYKVCLTAANPAGSDQFCKIIELAVGINAEVSAFAVQLDRVSGLLHVVADQPLTRLYLVNMLGQEFFPALNDTGKEFSADIGNLQKGIYLLKLETECQAVSREILIY